MLTLNTHFFPFFTFPYQSVKIILWIYEKQTTQLEAAKALCIPNLWALCTPPLPPGINTWPGIIIMASRNFSWISWVLTSPNVPREGPWHPAERKKNLKKIKRNTVNVSMIPPQHDYISPSSQQPSSRQFQVAGFISLWPSSLLFSFFLFSLTLLVFPSKRAGT